MEESKNKKSDLMVKVSIKDMCIENIAIDKKYSMSDTRYIIICQLGKKIRYINSTLQTIIDNNSEKIDGSSTMIVTFRPVKDFILEIFHEFGLLFSKYGDTYDYASTNSNISYNIFFQNKTIYFRDIIEIINSKLCYLKRGIVKCSDNYFNDCFEFIKDLSAIENKIITFVDNEKKIASYNIDANAHC